MEQAASTNVDTGLTAAQQAVEAARRAWHQAIEAIEAIEDTDAAWELAGQLSDALPALQASAGQLRARLATRIRVERQLSLAGLAKHVGVSKSRAQGWVEAAAGGAGNIKATTRGLSEEAGVPNSREDR